MQMETYYNKGKGLTSVEYKAIKKFKVSKTKQSCSICCQQFEKGENIIHERRGNTSTSLQTHIP